LARACNWSSGAVTRQEQETEVLLKNEQVLLPLGAFCLVGSIALSRFAQGLPRVAFFEGLLLGASLVFNIAYLVRLRAIRDRSSREK
jgi:hypothetical protein